jgi:hypothetical protein
MDHSKRNHRFLKQDIRTDIIDDKFSHYTKKKNSIAQKDLIRSEIKGSLAEYADLAHLVGPYTVQYDAASSRNHTSGSIDIDRNASSFKKKR